MSRFNKVHPYSEEFSTEIYKERPVSDIDDPAPTSHLVPQDTTRFYIKKEAVTKWMLRQSDPQRVRWDLLVMLCAVYNSFLVPYEIAFETNEPVELFVLAMLVDVVFTIDIVLNFRTTYIDHTTGDEVSDPHKIAKHYVKSGHFFLDILATVPFDVLIGLTTGLHDLRLKLSTLLKLIHIMRLSKIINNLRISESKKIVIRLAQIVLNIVMFVHCIGCAWSMIAEIDQKWRPPSEGPLSDFYEAKVDKKYSFSLYHGVYMWAGVEINPQTQLEMFFLISVILVGSIIRAVMFGKLANLMQALSKDSEHISGVMDTANTSMKNMMLPEWLQLRVIDYLLATQHSLAKQEKFVEFINLIPPSLQTEVSEVIYAEIALECPILYKFPSMFKLLIQKLRVRFINPETLLILQGDHGDDMYYLVKGCCEVEVTDETKALHKVGQLRPGQYFGELALLYPTARTATVRSCGYSTIGELSKRDFFDLFSGFPDALKKIKKMSRKYNDPWKTFVVAALKRIPYFKQLPDHMLNLVMYSLHSISLETDSSLFKQGNVIDRLYIVAEGNLNLYIDVKTKTLQRTFQNNYRNRGTRASVIAVTQQLLFKNIIHLGEFPKTTNPYSSATMKLEYARAGNVLNASQAILRTQAVVNCVTTERTVLLYISASEIEDLMRTSLQLKQGVEAVKAKRLKYDSLRGQVLKIVPPIDLIRSFAKATSNEKLAWRGTLRVKNALISLIIRKRQAKKSGLGNISAMVIRLRAMMKAESLGYQSVAKKIASGEVHHEAVNVFEVLNELELTNPMLLQFAVKIKQMNDVTAQFDKGAADLLRDMEPTQAEFREIGSDVGRLKEMVGQLEEFLR
jgi:CRP-like cAMP-binding protein